MKSSKAREFALRPAPSYRLERRRVVFPVITPKCGTRNDILHQISHLQTASAGVNLALSLADAAMSRLVTFTAYKAGWRGRRVEKIDPWVPVHSSLFPMRLHQFRHEEPRSGALALRGARPH